MDKDENDKIVKDEDKDEFDDFLVDLRFLYDNSATESTVSRLSLNVEIENDTIHLLIDEIIEENPYNRSHHSGDLASPSMSISENMNAVNNVRKYVQQIENSSEMENFKRCLRQDMYANILLKDNNENVEIIDIPEVERPPRVEDDSSEEDYKFNILLQKFKNYTKNKNEESSTAIIKATENINTSESCIVPTKIEENRQEAVNEKESLEQFKKYELECDSSFVQNEDVKSSSEEQNMDEQVMEDLIKLYEKLKITDENENKDVHEVTSEERKKATEIPMTSIGCQYSIQDLMTSACVQTSKTPSAVSIIQHTTPEIIDKRLSAPAVLETTNAVICEEPKSTMAVNWLSGDIRRSPSRELNTEKSSGVLLLTRASDVHSNIDARPLIRTPCEREYHTIHIEAISSPSSSVLRRLPLWTRMWNVCCDFCAATCICLQVTNPCIFCILLTFIVFVSTYILISTINGILNIDPHMHHYSTMTTKTYRFAEGGDIYYPEDNQDTHSNGQWSKGPIN